MRFIGLILLTSVAASGCLQGVGDRCQVMSDCDDGLICAIPSNGDAQTGGICESPSGIGDLAVPDALQSVDMSTSD